MLAHDFIPALRYGAKILPSEIAGLIGLPWVGDVFYIDPINGSDSAGGRSMTDAFATLTAAYAAVASNHHDVIVVAPSGPGAGEAYATVETAAITWSKNQVHLVGNAQPTMFSERARIATATNALSPFVTVSGQGNSFHNVQFYNPGTTNLIGVRVSGNRNFFENVHFAGISDATAGDSASAYALELYGAQENRFVNCVVGLDTVTRTGANANLKFTLGSDTVARNVFDGCVFPMMADADAPRFIKAATVSSTDRFNLFRGCQFINAIGSTSTQQTDAFALVNSLGGLVILQDCLMVGATGWADNLTSLYALSTSSNATYNQGIGMAVNPNA